MLHAVVVGIDRYRDYRISNLRYARLDAEAVAGLIERIHPGERRVRLLLDEEATKRSLMVTIGEDLPRSIRHGDVVLLYFAGHGTPETNNGPDKASRYLVVHDSEYDNVYATCIDMERDLQRWFERIEKAALVLLLVDACFSGRAGGRTFEGPNLRRQRMSLRQEKPVTLRDLDLGEGRVMIAACDDTQVAREDAALGHGIFTYYFLHRRLEGKDNPRTIGLHALYEQLAASVREHTSGAQIPVINGRSAMARLPYLWDPT